MSTQAGSDPKAPRFIKQLKRLMSFLPGRPSREQWDADALALERRFLAERHSAIERELERRVEDLTYRHKDLAPAILRFARDPLPDAWGDGGIPMEIAARLRPLRRELEVIDALEGAVARRRLVEVIERALHRVEDEVMDLLQDARPSELYGDTYWTDELLEQILSHLLHLWAEWLNHRAGQDHVAKRSGP